EEVRRRLQADEAVVAAHDPVVGGAVALLRQADEEVIIDMNLRVRLLRESGHEQSFPGPLRAAGVCSVAVPSQGASCNSNGCPMLYLRFTLTAGATVSDCYGALSSRRPRCTIPYTSTAAAALAFSDWTWPRGARRARPPSLPRIPRCGRSPRGSAGLAARRARRRTGPCPEQLGRSDIWIAAGLGADALVIG